MAFEAAPQDSRNGEGWYGYLKPKAPSLMGDDDGPHRPIRIVATTSFGNAGKAFELCFCLADVALGIAILLDKSVGNGSILVVARSMLGFSGLISFLLSLGIVGLIALLFNMFSSHHIWARLRVICDIGRVMLWWSFANSMSLTRQETGHLSPMVLYSFGLVAFGVFVVYLAAKDVRPNS